MKPTITILAAVALAIASQSAFANPPVCNSGHTGNWKPQATLKKQLVAQGLKSIVIKVTLDCYEVAAVDGKGQNLQLYFHPVTLGRVGLGPN